MQQHTKKTTNKQTALLLLVCQALPDVYLQVLDLKYKWTDQGGHSTGTMAPSEASTAVVV